LRPFDTADADWFFGRDREAAALAHRLAAVRFTAVVGPSGSGKSSLVNAGAVPALRADGWRTVVARPGFAPLARLADALSRASKEERLATARRDRFEAMLRASAFGVTEAVAALGAEAERLLLVIDQFEEVFRFGEDAEGPLQAAMREEGRAFIELLLTAAQAPGAALHVCITMRSDYFGNCAAFAGLAEAISESQFLVPLPRREQLEAAIRRPVERAGAEIAPGLVQRLLVDAGEEHDPLPLLQHTLRRLWEASSGTPRRLTADEYGKIGRIAGSIHTRAEAVLTDLGKTAPVDLITAERVMKALTHLDDRGRATRRPARRSALMALVRDTPGVPARDADASLGRVIGAMSAEANSFLRPDEDSDSEVDIGHEALIRSWQRLSGTGRNFVAGWLREEMEDGQRWRGYVQRCEERTYLSRNAQKGFARWVAQHRIGGVWSERYGDRWAGVVAFHRTSRLRTRARIAVGALALLIVIAAPAVPLQQAYDRQQAAEREELRSERLGNLALAAEARAISHEGDARTGALLARAALPAGGANDDRYVDAAEVALADALAHPIEVMRLLGRSGTAWSAAFSPNGKHIVSASDDTTVRLWDAATGQPIGEPLRGHTNIVERAVFSPDGRRIVSASDDTTLRLWNADSGQPIGEPLRGHTGIVFTAAFSPDGRRIVSASDDTTVRLWDAATGQPIGQPLRGHTQAVEGAAFSPDGQRIVSASLDKTLRLWDATTGRPIGEPLRGHTGAVYVAAFSPDGRRIVSASQDTTLRLWDAATGQPIGGPLRGHTDRVIDAAFSPDGRRIVSASWDDTLRLWDALSGQPIEEPLRGHTDPVMTAMFSPDGKRIVSASQDATLRLWDATPSQLICEPLRGHTGAVRSAAFSPDGKRIVSASGDNTLRLWDAISGKPMGEPLRGHTDTVENAAFSLDGKRIVSASDDGTLRLWDAISGQPIGEPLRGHTGAVVSAAFSLDGKRIVSASGDNTLRLWDATTGQSIGEPLRGHTDTVENVTFSPDGRRIVSASDDGTLRLWDAVSGRPIGEPLRGHTGQVFTAAFSPDGRSIVSASADATLRLWDATTGRAIGQPLRGHTYFVYSATFSPDGRRIVSASRDNTIRVWDAMSGKPIGEPLRGHTDAVTSAAFSPDGRSIVSASSDATLRLWDDAPFMQSEGELITTADRLCPLNREERKAQGLFDPKFPQPLQRWTAAQKQACGGVSNAAGDD
jgi:WD40 repeat protein